MYAWSPLPRSLAATFRDAQSSKPRVRESAVGDLVRWASGGERERCLRELEALLGADPDLEVRAAAAIALADAEATESVAQLVAAAQHGPSRVRQMALVALGEIAQPEEPRALAAVRAGLDSELPALRFQALVAAHRLFADAALQPELERALGDAEAKVRYVACRIIEERYFGSAGSSAPAALLALLGDLLADTDPAVALAAAIPLSRSGSERARSALVSALNRPSAAGQVEDEQAAIELCAELGLNAARPGLVARAWGGWLGSKSPLAFQARVALARLGDERASAHILRGLSAWSRGTRTRAVAAAGQARLEAARARLQQMRGDERQADPEAVSEALQALDLSREQPAFPQPPSALGKSRL
ncbi:MAG TPA: HEAT repeat domain-containing protein [Polyangiaceae bacterium]|jgi:HEAT repeat protein|nr:HEAT repeat domain-containing protein [Polyangiaceae bacterium]